MFLRQWDLKPFSTSVLMSEVGCNWQWVLKNVLFYICLKVYIYFKVWIVIYLLICNPGFRMEWRQFILLWVIYLSLHWTDIYWSSFSFLLGESSTDIMYLSDINPEKEDSHSASGSIHPKDEYHINWNYIYL